MEVKDFLRKYNLKPNFTYGQNFLTDENVLDDIIRAAGVASGDQILEIGPGIGNLTRKLLNTEAFVLSIEKDPKFLPILKSIKKDFKKNFRFEIADALEFNFQDFFLSQSGTGYKVAANIPYYITGKILQMLLAAKNKPASITILTQKEVAQNIIAKPGNLSLLAISVQIHGEPKIIKTVPAKSFYPAPKVDSAILHIDLYKKPKYEFASEKKFFSVLRACFAGKRKQIHNTLANNLHLEKNIILEILSETKINPAARPQELSIEQWIELVNNLQRLTINN
jgi:16S rRNA (adenine1518-N6/adenine1519-N6)-dimethyltransferase